MVNSFRIAVVVDVCSSGSPSATSSFKWHTARTTVIWANRWHKMCHSNNVQHTTVERKWHKLRCGKSVGWWQHTCHYECHDLMFNLNSVPLSTQTHVHTNRVFCYFLFEKNEITLLFWYFSRVMLQKSNNEQRITLHWIILLLLLLLFFLLFHYFFSCTPWALVIVEHFWGKNKRNCE